MLVMRNIGTRWESLRALPTPPAPEVDLLDSGDVDLSMTLQDIRCDLTDGSVSLLVEVRNQFDGRVLGGANAGVCVARGVTSLSWEGGLVSGAPLPGRPDWSPVGMDVMYAGCAARSASTFHVGGLGTYPDSEFVLRLTTGDDGGLTVVASSAAWVLVRVPGIGAEWPYLHRQVPSDLTAALPQWDSPCEALFARFCDAGKTPQHSDLLNTAMPDYDLVTRQCPVCGWPEMSAPAALASGVGRAVDCPCCTTLFTNVAPGRWVDYLAARREWIEAGMPWRSGDGTPPPEGWSAATQLASLPDEPSPWVHGIEA